MLISSVKDLYFQCLSAGTALVCFRASVLLFRAAPNSKIMDLITVLIEGDKTVR